ncbi:MAG: hypothetical protein P8076_06805 [Gammaproteobacteria bacterium]
MILDVYVEDRLLRVQIPPQVMEQGEDFFAMMDRDMDKGWRMGPTYIENPDTTQRAQIAAWKMLTAIDTENDRLLNLLAGYIVSRVPGVTAVRLANDGDVNSTEIVTR